MQKWLRYTSIAVCLFLSSGAAEAQTCKYGNHPSTSPSSRFIDNYDGTVTDTVTNLMWKRCSEGQTWDGVTCIGAVNSYDYWHEEAIQVAENVVYAGFSDWRLPNIKELTSIIELACHSPAINSSIFPETPGSHYWTSTPYFNVININDVLVVNFNNGDAFRDGAFAHQDRFIRVVRDN